MRSAEQVFMRLLTSKIKLRRPRKRPPQVETGCADQRPSGSVRRAASEGCTCRARQHWSGLVTAAIAEDS